MAGFLIGMLSGMLMSIQGVFNTEVTKATDIWVSSIIVQGTALITAVVMWYATGRKSFAGVGSIENRYVLLGGVIGAFITYTVIKAISMLGVARANFIIVVTQIAAAYLIELFGLFGTKKGEFSLMKFLGILLAVAGLVMFSFGKIKA